MKFVPYVKLTSDIGTQLFHLDSALPASLPRLADELIRLLPSTPGVSTRAELKELETTCRSIVNIIEEHEDCDDIAESTSYFELLGFLEESSGDLEMILRQEPETINQLVDCASEGGLDDEWTKHYMSREAEKNLATLKEWIGDSARSKDCFAIIRLLLLCFPSDEVAPTINAFVDRTDDQELKEQAVFLLTVFDA